MNGASVWLRQVTVMTLKELKQLRHDRALFIYIAYIFTLNIFLAAGAASLELSRAPVAVVDGDRSAASRELVSRFLPPYFREPRHIDRPHTALNLLDHGDAKLVLDIPADFQRELLRGNQPVAVQAQVDTGQANSGFLASNYASRIVAGYSEEWTRHYLTEAGLDPRDLPRIDNRVRLRYNPDLREPWFSTLSELLSMMTVACILLPAAAMVREKERGTIEQLLVTPLSPFQIMIAKVLSMSLVMLAGATVALYGIMVPFYGVPVRGSAILFFLLTALYAFTNAGLGLVAATYARTSAQAGMLVLLMVMPIITLSGTWTPLASMPSWLRTVMFISPLRHFVDIAYGILLRGAGLDTLWDSVLAMGLLGLALFAWGMARFRRQFG